MDKQTSTFDKVVINVQLDSGSITLVQGNKFFGFDHIMERHP